MYVQRTLEFFIKESAKHFPVLLIAGARQVGKTTLLQHLSKKERAFVTMDNPMVLSLAKNDPALFMQRFKPPLLIDEIQYAPEILPYIKMEVDKNHKPGQFWLNGSQQFHLMRGISESLAGRIAVINLYGMSRQELEGHGNKSRPFLPLPDEIRRRASFGRALPLDRLYSLIWRGSLPEIALNERMDRDLFYGSYVQTYIQRDIRDLARVGNEMTFLRFLRAAAARTGQMLNIADLARDADISYNTAKSWLSILQASYIVYLLEPYHTNLTKRLVKTPKLYFLDTGLCAYLTEWSSPKTLEAGAMSGAILETWILLELLKCFSHNGRRAPFYYYRDKDRKEIDLLIVQDGILYPVEFKKTASPGRDAVQHFQILEKLKMPIGPGGVICLIDKPLPLTSSVEAIPVSSI